ncbi:RNA polymerase sigma-70 factor (ECF subfamily) [Stackebrandtia albiflava]|uniref:RNA polymerase sigma-70 factor (ECF subfamily) n=1 Tax=Stackebrandtia albiflava TaxID=406432 RepID=A0A562VDF4_9ACTN|nr:DUF6596 domain-containing protein [Stackebrandtia albiflava]TWJ15888.1 RNA polymerase sigma-70 factor (ECF subfamily) [Stackebrandtia albiflava]
MTDVGDRLDQAWRRYWPRLVAGLAARFRDLGLAEDAAADAFAAASRVWPVRGVPDEPMAWLTTAATRRAVDRVRRERVRARSLPLLLVDEGDDDDDLLRLVFTCCHPALSVTSQVALTLRYVLGVPTAEVAALLTVAESAMAARLTRARAKLSGAGVAYRVPSPEELPQRLSAVLSVVYLAFTRGYAPRRGGEVASVEVAADAIALGRMLGDLMPGEPEVRALSALMMLQHSRRDARVDADGGLVLLPDQDRGLWRMGEVAEAVRSLRGLVRAGVTGGRYFLEACIAAEHCVAGRPQDTDWRRIAGLYARLEVLTGSPVVRVNRAVAVAEVEGPQAGLDLLEGVDGLLPRFHLLWAVRADLAGRLGRRDEAVAAYRRALESVTGAAQRRFLEDRLARWESQPEGS